MNRKLTFAAARLAILVFKLRVCISRSLCSTLFAYCRATSRFVMCLHDLQENLISSLKGQCALVRAHHQSLCNEATCAHNDGPGWQPQTRLWVSRSLLRIEGYGLMANSTLVDVTRGISVVSISSMEGALDITGAEIRAFERNADSLNAIFSKPPTPISGLELILWIVTSSLHVNDTLGDFREAYENKRSKRGPNEAIAWARSQVYRDVANRLGGISKFIGWSVTAYEWIKKAIHKH